MASLILAIRFLTIVPVPGREAEGPGALGRAAWWFPVVGLALGAVLALADTGLTRLFPPLVSTALVLALWKVLTGGIHLDGLADCLDGLAGRDPQQRVAIMRDTRLGVFGAVGLVLLLLLAFAALAETPAALRWRVLFLAPAAGRLAPLWTAARFRPATPDRGLGANFLQGVSALAGWIHLVWVLGLAATLLRGSGALVVIPALLLVECWCRLLAARFGGLTGDGLGSVVELTELLVLLAAAAFVHAGFI